jgi:hypothetical protein
MTSRLADLPCDLFGLAVALRLTSPDAPADQQTRAACRVRDILDSPPGKCPKGVHPKFAALVRGLAPKFPLRPDALVLARLVVQEQAEDDGLWFEPLTAAEDYLQHALRRLHAAVEGDEPAIHQHAPEEALNTKGASDA